MNETQILMGLLAALWAALVAMLGWWGSRVIVRLDLMVDKLNSVAGELHMRINGIDTRLTRVETKVDL